MEVFYVKGLGLVPNTPENRLVLIKTGHVKDDTIITKSDKPVRADVKRVKRSGSTK